MCTKILKIGKWNDNIYEFKNAIVCANIHEMCMIDNDTKHAIEQSCYVTKNRSYPQFQNTSVSTVPIFWICGSYSHNIQHFIVECAYKLMYFNELKQINPNVKIAIVSGNGGNGTFITEIIQLLGMDMSDVANVSNGTLYETVYMTDHMVFNFAEQNERLKDFIVKLRKSIRNHVDTNNDVRETLTSVYLTRDFEHALNSRIFLSEAIVIESARQKNIDVVLCENMTSYEKINKLWNSKKIITHIGANLMNVLFNDRIESMLIITPKSFAHAIKWFDEFVKYVHPDINIEYVVCSSEFPEGRFVTNCPYKLCGETKAIIELFLDK